MAYLIEIANHLCMRVLTIATMDLGLLVGRLASAMWITRGLAWTVGGMVGEAAGRSQFGSVRRWPCQDVRSAATRTVVPELRGQ